MAACSFGAAAVLAVLALLCLLCALNGAGRAEGFASKEALQLTREVQEAIAAAGGFPTFSAAKKTIGGVDTVLLEDLEGLHKTRRLNPEAVQQLLANIPLGNTQRFTVW